MRKTVLHNVFSPTGDFLKTATSASFVQFSKEIDAGLGECVLDVAEPFDYSGPEVQLGNIIEILISDSQTVQTAEGSALIYKGYVSLVEPFADGTREGIRVHLLGIYTKLALDILKSGTQTTLYTEATNGLTTSSPSAAADAGKVIRAIIARYRAETANPLLSYSATSIPDVSQTLSYTFEQKTYREALDLAKDACPTGYFYYVDQHGIVWLKQKASTPTHTFVLGKHFQSVQIERSMEKIRNVLLIWNGETGASTVYKEYKDLDSIAQHGRRVETMNDYGIADVGSADNIGNRFIAENKDPDIRVVCEIMDNNIDPLDGYDIESIEPGDTCRFVGFDEDLSTIFRDNMLITKVSYRSDKVELTIENTHSDLVEQAKRTRDLANQVSLVGVPDTYTV